MSKNRPFTFVTSKKPCKKCGGFLCYSSSRGGCVDCSRKRGRDNYARKKIENNANKLKKVEKQIETLHEWIIDYMLDNNFSPSSRDICDNFNLSRSTIDALLCEMKGRKLIDWMPNKPRTIQIAGIYYCDDR